MIRGLWEKFRGWPAWAQIVTGIVVAAVVVGPLVSDEEPEAEAPPAAAEQTPEPETTPEIPEPDPRPAYSEDDLEYKLAVIDEAAFSVDDPVLDRYRRALNKVEQVCPDADREMISDQAVRSTQLLADEGVDATALEMLNAAGEVREARELRIECSEVFATLVVLMIEGS